jgi:hypothetical protein
MTTMRRHRDVMRPIRVRCRLVATLVAAATFWYWACVVMFPSSLSSLSSSYWTPSDWSFWNDAMEAFIKERIHKDFVLSHSGPLQPLSRINIMPDVVDSRLHTKAFNYFEYSMVEGLHLL